MKKKLILTSVLAVVAALVALAAFTGCGGPSNLEEYYDENPSELTELQSAVSSEDIEGWTKNLEVKANAIIISYNCTEDMNDEEIAAIEEVVDSLATSFQENFVEYIQNIEDATGLDGITFEMDFYTKDGTLINGLNVAA